jgi:hypothetical protein
MMLIKRNAFALGAMCCVLGTLLPNASFAALNDIACDAIWRGCLDKCGSGGGTQSCTNRCDNRRAECVLGLPTSKQQTPPPPCTGIHCTLRGSNPPTTVGPPNRKPNPVQPVRPVGVSNPNKTSTGNTPVILERKNDSGEREHRR